MKEIHYLLGNDCNLNCDFCFWNIKMKDVSLKFKKKIIDEIIDTGIKKVTVSGGEPTCAKNFIDVLEYMHNNGLKIILHTNGLDINKKNYKKIASFVTRVSLAIDGSNKNISMKMRKNKGMTKHTLTLINLFHSFNVPVSVKTLITRVNKKDILKIGELLKNKPILYWSLLEFNPINRGELHKSKFLLEDDKFDLIVKKAKKKFPELEIKIKMFKRKPQKYCFIASQGQVYTYIPGEGNVQIGDLKKESLNEIISKRF